MHRLALALVLLLAVAGCDLFGPDSGRFVGTWESVAVEETTVVSTIAQRYDGLDIRGEGAIEISGGVTATITHPDGGPLGPRSWELRNRDRTVLLWIYDERSFLGVVPAPSEPGTGTFYQIPALDATVDGEALTASVPRQTVVLEDEDGVALGEVTIGGSLAARTLDLPANVPVGLPATERTFFSSTLTLAADGTATSVGSDDTSRPGTWTADGDAVSVTLETSGSSTFTTVYDLIDGRLVRFGQVDQPQATDSVERQRGLQRGSLASARSTFSTVYTRID